MRNLLALLVDVFTRGRPYVVEEFRSFSERGWSVVSRHATAEVAAVRATQRRAELAADGVALARVRVVEQPRGLLW